MTINSQRSSPAFEPAKRTSLDLQYLLKRLYNHPSTKIFILTFLFYVVIGSYSVLVHNVGNNDGIARIASAFSAVFGRDPHLSAIGFIWPPLPALTDVPFVILLHPFRLEILSGTLMSAAYAGLMMIQLNEILARFEVEIVWRYVWMALFGLQPLIVHNAALGLSEVPFIAFLLFSLNGYLIWREEGKNRGIMLAGIGCWLALYTRYEALAWVAAMAVGITWKWLVDGRKESAEKLEANLLAFLVPPAYGFVFWTFLNWMIMGNPFHFLVGPGATSNTPDTANAVGVTHRWYYAMNSVGGSLKLLFEEFSFLGPLMIVATIVLLVVIVVKKRWIDFDFLMIFWSIAIFTVLIGYRGFLPGFTRYFIWLIPGGILVMGAVYQTLEAKWLRLVANFFVIVLLLFPMLQQVSTKWYANEQPLWEKTILTWMIAGEEQDFSAENGNMIDLKIIAEYLNQQPDGTTTLADHSLASVLGLMVDRPKDLIMTTDTDFSEILRNPPSNVDQILVPYPSFDAKGRSEVLKLYPGIYDGFETWTTFLYEFPTSQQWRLYLVNNPEKVEN